MKIIGSDKGLRSPEFHMKKEKERKIRLSLNLVLVVLILIAPIVFVHSKRFLIKNIQVSGNTVTKNADIASIVERDLSGNYGYIIPKASSFFYPKHMLEADIVATIPRLGSAVISRTSWQGISVAVTERAPSALYCTNVADINAPGGCYFMDNKGFIFSEAPSFSGGVYITYTSDPRIGAPLGKSFLDEDTFTKLTAMLGDLSVLHLTPKVLAVESDGSYNLSLPSGTVLMWKAKDDPKSVESNLVSFMNDTSVLGPGHTVDDLLYIDLRFGNKVFYKFRNE